jgi:hypothetical protein
VEVAIVNYQKHYDAIIKRARERKLTCYLEKHHVVPLCILHNTDTVELTPEEHYVAHQLLIKIFPGNNKLVFAAHAMTRSTRKVIRSNKLYGWIRRIVAEEFSKLNPMRDQKNRDLASVAVRERNKRLGNPMKIESVKEKFRGVNSPVARSIVCVETRQEFKCINDAAKWLRSRLGSANAQSLQGALKNASVVAYGFHWRRLDD